LPQAASTSSTYLLCGFDRSAQGNAWASIYQQ
jgi:hypothetical protein